MTLPRDCSKIASTRTCGGSKYFDDDGGCYVTIFSGPMAYERARAYYGALKNRTLAIIRPDTIQSFPRWTLLPDGITVLPRARNKSVAFTGEF
jgi:hypothetical protein